MRGPCAALVLLLSWGGAHAESAPNPYLAQAKVFYQGLEFEKCLKRLVAAEKWKGSTVASRADTELYFGLCKLGLGREDEAAQHFDKALQLDGGLTLPPYQSPKVKAVFGAARKKVVAPVVEAPERSPPTAVVEPVPDRPVVPPTSSLVPQEPLQAALLAPEAKQKPLRLAAPIALASTAAVAAGVAAYFGVSAKNLERQANAAPFESDAIALGQQARTHALLANGGWGLAGAVGVAAVVTYFVQN